MTNCKEFMQSHGRKIHRHQGGYWAQKNWNINHGRCFGTCTVNALVTRGVAEYTRFIEGKNGRFPVEAELIE